MTSGTWWPREVKTVGVSRRMSQAVEAVWAARSSQSACSRTWTGILGPFRTLLAFPFQTALSKAENHVHPHSVCDTQDKHKATRLYLNSIYKAIFLTALVSVGYTIRQTLSFLSVTPKDSADALSKHIPVRHAERRMPHNLNPPKDLLDMY